MQRLYTALVIVIVLVGGYFVYKNWREPSLDSSPAEINLQADSASTAPVSEPALTPSISSNKTMYATISTNYGDIELALDSKLAPHAVDNFIKLAQTGFYDGTRFHRVIKGFMIQGGDPLSKDVTMKSRWGTGGPGYQFADEITPDSKNVVGSLAMANSGPNTNGSQFYINAVDNDNLDGGYVVFGKVVSGMDVVTKIDNVPTDSNDRPIDDVLVSKVTVSDKK